MNANYTPAKPEVPESIMTSLQLIEKTLATIQGGVVTLMEGEEVYNEVIADLKEQNIALNYQIAELESELERYYNIPFFIRCFL